MSTTLDVTLDALEKRCDILAKKLPSFRIAYDAAKEGNVGVVAQYMRDDIFYRPQIDEELFGKKKRTKPLQADEKVMKVGLLHLTYANSISKLDILDFAPMFCAFVNAVDENEKTHGEQAYTKIHSALGWSSLEKVKPSFKRMLNYCQAHFMNGADEVIANKRRGITLETYVARAVTVANWRGKPIPQDRIISWYSE